MSNHETQHSPICPLCNEAVELQSNKTNEGGTAFHEECYVLHLRPAHSPSRAFNGTRASWQPPNPPAVISRDTISAYLTGIGLNGGWNGGNQKTKTITKRNIPPRRKQTKPTETRALDYSDTMSSYEKESRAAEAQLGIDRQRKNLAVPCPTCGAAPGKKCELTNGAPRSQPHRDRRTIAKENL